MKTENALSFPDLRKRGVHDDLSERYFAISGNVELQVVARLVIQSRRTRLRFENKLLDERGDVLVAHHAEGVRRLQGGRFVLGRGQVDEDLAVVLAGPVRLQGNAGRRTPRRTIGNVEPPVVLGALDESAADKAVGQMGIAMRAEPVAGVELPLRGAIDGVCPVLVIEAENVLATQELGVADLDPAAERPAFRGEDCAHGRGAAGSVGVGNSRRMK